MGCDKGLVPIIDDGFHDEAWRHKRRNREGLMHLADSFWKTAQIRQTPASKVSQSQFCTLFHMHLRRSMARRDPGDALAPEYVRRLLGITKEEGGQWAADPSGARTTDAPLLVSRAPAREQPWEMPRFGDGGTAADDERFEIGGGAEDFKYQDLEPLDPSGAPEDRSDAAAPAAAAGLDALFDRAHRALGAFNDPQTVTGRARMAVADPAYDQAGRLEAWLQAVPAAANCPAALCAAISLDALRSPMPTRRRQ